MLAHARSKECLKRFLHRLADRPHRPLLRVINRRGPNITLHLDDMNLALDDWDRCRINRDNGTESQNSSTDKERG